MSSIQFFTRHAELLEFLDAGSSQIHIDNRLRELESAQRVNRCPVSSDLQERITNITQAQSVESRLQAIQSFVHYILTETLKEGCDSNDVEKVDLTIYKLNQRNMNYDRNTMVKVALQSNSIDVINYFFP